ncbi:alpha/beta fold hydrolase [Agrobacterium sp. FDAARGOS_525]|uniref:alpha/beta fold hydrolase n=2 Tax=Hyphomicrobiales TaxID=356 RepID=UPI000F66286C|nr:alpha/beta fold hydrolase [Aureimonas altamirensis]RSC37112.1 alpha/beta fold hydrolase [Agrobacterium sp. FDAARGOS_525]
MTRLVPPGAKSRSVVTSFGLLRVLHAPSGSDDDTRLPILLIHGGGSDNAGISWYRLMNPLSQSRSVWAPDLPGFGGSVAAAPVGGPGALAAVTIDLLDQLGISRAIVFGVSMGGDVALNLALRHSERVAGLVLIAPGGLVPMIGNHQYTHFLAWLAAQTPDWLLLPAIRFSNRFTVAALGTMVADPSNIPPEVVAEFVREARQPRGGIAYARYNQVTLGQHGMRNDMSSYVHNVTVPTLFFHGVEDRLVPPEASQRAASRMAQSRLVIVPHCGHWAQLEAHDQFLSEVNSFLAIFDRRHD